MAQEPDSSVAELERGAVPGDDQPRPTPHGTPGIGGGGGSDPQTLAHGRRMDREKERAEERKD